MLHATKEKPNIRRKVLMALTEKNISIFLIYLDKAKFPTRLRNDMHRLYNSMAHALIERIYKEEGSLSSKMITIIASRRETSTFINKTFRRFLQESVTVEIKTPQQEKCLQIVDFISWALFRKYEYHDEGYSKIIRGKIVFETCFPHKQNPGCYL